MISERPTHDPLAMQKGILWEQAKGLMRAMVAVDGSRYSSRPSGEKARYEQVSEAIEAFVESFESEGLHE